MASLISTTVMTTRNNSVMNRIERDYIRLVSMETRAGLPDGAEVGRPTRGSEPRHSDTMKDLAEIASMLEFGGAGSGGKTWPFMTQSFLANIDSLKDESADQFSKLTRNIITPNTVLEKIGDKHALHIKKQIRIIRTPSLSAFTIAAKGSNKPLIDTGLMLNSITHIESRTT